MKPLEIKGARARLGYKQRHMAEKLGIPVSSYCNKENGVAKFTDVEKVKVAELLGFTPEQMNDFLFDGILPIGSNSRQCDSSAGYRSAYLVDHYGNCN